MAKTWDWDSVSGSVSGGGNNKDTLSERSVALCSPSRSVVVVLGFYLHAESNIVVTDLSLCEIPTPCANPHAAP